MQVISAPDLDKNGWNRITVALAREGRVAVLEGGMVEAIIITPAEYAKLVENLRKSEGLATLRARFDADLACLNEPNAAERLISAMAKPTRLDGKVKAGDF